MPYSAANAIPVAAGWTPQATFLWSNGSAPGAKKLDAFVNHTDVVVQLLEAGEAWEDDQTKEILLRQGFNSRETLTPFIGWRFKVWSGTLLSASGTVDVSALA